MRDAALAERSVRRRRTVFSLLVTYFIALSFYLFFKVQYAPEISVRPLSLLMGLFLYTLLFFLVWGICRDLFIANTVLASLFGVLTLVNAIKIYFTNDPILFTDLIYLNDAGEIVSIAGDSFDLSFLPVILPTLGYWAVLAGLLVLTSRCRRKLSTGWRVGSVAVSLVILAILLTPGSDFRKAALNGIYGIDEDHGYASNAEHYAERGILSGMYAHYLLNRTGVPEGYDANKSRSSAAAAPESASHTLGTPNIIVYFAESFFDIDRIPEIGFDKEVTPNLHQLRDEGIYFEMISPSFSGISGNVEFEFLTGANLTYFGNGYIPYMQLFTNDKYYHAPTIIRELKQNGYFTHIVTYTGPKLFNCGRFYDYAGVDQVEFNTEVPSEFIKGFNVSEEHVVDEIIREFDHKKPGQREYYMVMTMQTHSPYTIDKYDRYDISLIKSPFDKSMNEELVSYAQGIHDTDQQLARLYEYVKTLSEPTLIVFYGDHLPQIANRDGVGMLDRFDYFNTGDPALDLFRKYNTQCLILANFPLEQPEYDYLSPDLVSAYILNQMDIRPSDYYRWLYQNAAVLPAMNKFIACDGDGTPHLISDLPAEMKNAYAERKRMQYFTYVDGYK